MSFHRSCTYPPFGYHSAEPLYRKGPRAPARKAASTLFAPSVYVPIHAFGIFPAYYDRNVCKTIATFYKMMMRNILSTNMASVMCTPPTQPC